MEIEFVKPDEIEKRSFAILSKELENMGVHIDKENECVVKRCIHTTADFDYARTLRFSDNAIAEAIKLIEDGADIITDTNMALSGINKKELARYGGRVRCFMADEEIAKEAKARSVTRAVVSMEHAMRSGRKQIFVVGNAPTALISLWESYERGIYVPAFIIGVPVGFVNVVEAKKLIIDSDIPYIVNEGRKGGSNVAAAICNAILYRMRDKT